MTRYGSNHVWLVFSTIIVIKFFAVFSRSFLQLLIFCSVNIPKISKQGLGS